MGRKIGWPSPAMIVAIAALVAALGGTTWAAAGGSGPNGGAQAGASSNDSANAGAVAKNSLTAAQRRRRAIRRKRRQRARRRVIPSRNTVGVRQLKRNAVVTGKIRNNAIAGAKVRNKSLTGADINLNLLGKVPEAEEADHADESGSVDGHDAECPGGTVLIRGVCFDSESNGPAGSLNAASDACASQGGWLPNPLQLRAVRTVINLGTGTGTDQQFTDTIYANTSGSNYRTIVVDGQGQLAEYETDQPSEYICVYPLVR